MSENVQYMIRDAQGHEYGPADVTLLRQWIGERRILGHFQIAPVGTQDWVAVSEHPDLASAFASPEAPATPAPTDMSPSSYGGEAVGGPVDPYRPSPGGYAPQSTNPLAIVSLVLSLAGLITCGLTAIVGIILGFVARGQIRRNPSQGGDGMALAGIIVGFVLVGLGCLMSGCIVFAELAGSR